MVTFTGCCAPCEPVNATQFVAVSDPAGYQERKGCGPIACSPCQTSDQGENRRYFGATCNAGYCELFDVRLTDFSRCGSDADCTLRAGLDCCERCDATPEMLIAVNKNSDVRDLVCGADAGACPPCVPIYPEGYSAGCNQGVCEVRYEFN
jgi:hypothetical protein